MEGEDVSLLVVGRINKYQRKQNVCFGELLNVSIYNNIVEWTEEKCKTTEKEQLLFAMNERSNSIGFICAIAN